MDADDLCGLRGRQVDGFVNAHDATVGSNEFVTVANRLDGGALKQDASVLGHAIFLPVVQPPTGRSNQTWTWLVPIEFS